MMYRILTRLPTCQSWQHHFSSSAFTRVRLAATYHTQVQHKSRTKNPDGFRVSQTNYIAEATASTK
jgi:hypothetical protein